MTNTWQSSKTYQHPAKHRVGTYGQLCRLKSGVYVLRVGSTYINCPQDWASKIEHEETQNQKA